MCRLYSTVTKTPVHMHLNSSVDPRFFCPRRPRLGEYRLNVSPKIHAMKYFTNRGRSKLSCTFKNYVHEYVESKDDSPPLYVERDGECASSYIPLALHSFRGVMPCVEHK